ncbi:MAG: hypothetical protein EBX40_02430 [Gammaproteobacteria bacterium]|nr:hypothetical protein [Gammaproteobacteria bacterium]
MDEWHKECMVAIEHCDEQKSLLNRQLLEGSTECYQLKEQYFLKINALQQEMVRLQLDFLREADHLRQKHGELLKELYSL